MVIAQATTLSITLAFSPSHTPPATPHLILLVLPLRSFQNVTNSQDLNCHSSTQSLLCGFSVSILESAQEQSRLLQGKGSRATQVQLENRMGFAFFSER